jgi:hypothetical protein
MSFGKKVERRRVGEIVGPVAALRHDPIGPPMISKSIPSSRALGWRIKASFDFSGEGCMAESGSRIESV